MLTHHLLAAAMSKPKASSTKNVTGLFLYPVRFLYLFTLLAFNKLFSW
jgi:hypothetical protein